MTEENVLKVNEAELKRGSEQVWFLLVSVTWDGAINWEGLNQGKGGVFIPAVLMELVVKIYGFRRWSHGRKIHLLLSNRIDTASASESTWAENFWMLRKWAGKRSQHYCPAIAWLFPWHLHLGTLIPGHRAGLDLVLLLPCNIFSHLC